MTREEALAALSGAGPAAVPPGPELVAPQPSARPEPELNAWVDDTLYANRKKNFVQRVIAPEFYPVLDRSDGKFESHQMGWGEDDTGPFVFPSIVQDPATGQLVKPENPMRYAEETGELIRFETKEEADAFSREYKRAWRVRRYVDQIGPQIPLEIAAEADPDAKLRSMGIGERLRVPPDVVADDLEYWERLDLEQRALEASGENPAIAAMIANPDKAPLALKHLVELQDLQSAMKLPDPVEVPPSEFVQAYGARGVEMLELGKLAWKRKDETATPAELERLEYLRQNPLPPIKDSESAFGAFAQWTTGGAIQTLPIMASSILGGTEVAVLTGATAAAFASPTGPGAGVAAAVAAPAGFAVGAWMDMTQIEGGLIYLAALDAADQIQLETGERPSEDAMRALSTLGGMGGGALEALSFGVLARLFPGGKRLVRAFSHEGIKRALASTTTRAALGRFAVNAGGSIATEGSTEALQQIVPALTEGILRDMTLEGDQNWQPEDFWTQLADAGMAGAGPAISLAGLAAVTSVTGAQIQRTRSSRARLKRLDDQVAAVDASELRVQAPAILHEYLQDLLAQNPEEQTLFIDPRALDVAVGGRAALERVLPDAAAQLDEAMTVKGEVAVPLADYLTYLSEYHQILKQHARVGLKSLTAPEAAQAEADFSSRLQREIDRQASERDDQTPVEQSAHRVFDDVFEQLVREGTSPEQARAAASLWRGAMATMALQQKVDPWEFYSRMNLRIEGPVRNERPMKPRLAELKDRERLKATLKAVQDAAQGAPPPLKFPEHPVLGILRKRGGVDPESTLAGELRNMGVTSQTHPGLYRRGGLEYLDDLDIAEEPVLVGNIPRPDPESAYLDPNDLLAAIDAELRGNPLRSEDEHAAIAAIEEPMRELVEFLDELGIDPQAATVDQVLELLQRQGVGRENTEDPLEEPEADMLDGTTLEQPAYHGTGEEFERFNADFIGSGEARGSVTFNQELTDVLIRLGKSRDTSTFLHESGHIFLELVLRGADSLDASERLRNDARTLLDWFGIASREEMTTEHHEKFARGFEAYLRDGKAPSVELRDAFARFQAWLVKLYRTLTTLNVEVAEPVRQVMDRMLASDAAIETARRVSGFMPVFKDRFAGGMTEAEWNDFHLRSQRVEDEQKRRLVQATIDDLEREKRAEFADVQVEIIEQVTADVNARPIFRLKQWLMTGKLPDGTKLEGLAHAKLDRDMLIDQFGQEIIKILRPGRFGVWQARGGLDPRVVANVFGFQGAQHMVTMLAETSSRQEAIAIEVEERLQKRFGDIFRDGRLAEAAIEALQTTEQIDFLLIEERMLARRIGERPTPGQILRDSARRRVAEIKIRDLRPEQYRSQSQRAATRALEAVRAENYATARDEKLAEILNYHLAREAEKAKDAAEKLRVYLLKVTKGPARARLGKAGADYLEQVDALLFRFGFKPISNLASAKKETLQQWIQAQQASGARLLFSQKMLDETFTVDWKALTLEELDELADLVKSIEATARTKTNLIASQDKRDLEEIRDELVTSIRSHVPREVPLLDPDDGTLVKLRHYARETHGTHFKLEALFKRLDGGVLGPAWEAFFRPFAEAEARENEMLERVGREFRALFDALHEEGEVVKAFWIPEIGQVLRLEQMLAIALNQGNEYNKTALIDGSGWNQQQVDAILDRLEERHWKAVVKIAKLIASFKDLSFELERELTGVAPKAVEPSHVVTKFGVLEGWYYPLKADPVRSRRAMQREDAQSAQELFGGNGYKPMTRHNHLIERQGWGKTPVWLSLNVASEHMYNTIHDITHRKALIQVDRLIQDPIIADAIERAVGRELYAQIRPWLKGIAGERIVVGAQFIDRFFGWIRQGATVAYMGLKVSVMLTQGLGILNALGPEGVGARRFFGEMGQFLAHGPLEGQRRASWAISMSPALKARLTSFDREARDAVKRGIFRTGGHDRTQAFMATIGYCDMAITVPTWIAAYHRAIENGKSSEDAVFEADSVVRLTMGSGSPKDLSAVQRGGELYRLFTMFYSAMNAIYAQQALTIAAIRDGRMTMGQIVSAAFYLWFLPAVLDDLIAGRGPDDDEGWWSWAASELAIYPAMTIVLARDVIGYGQNVARGEYLNFTFPAFNAMETTIRAAVMPAKDLLTEGEIKRSTARAMVEAVGFWGKLPSRQVWITTEAFYDLWTGQGEVLPQDLVLARPPERRAK